MGCIRTNITTFIVKCCKGRSFKLGANAMDKLERINNLSQEIQKNRLEKMEIEEQIRDLKNKSLELDQSYNDMQDTWRSLGKDQYKDKRLRKKIVNFSEKSDFPETAIKMRKYVNIKDWDSQEIPDDILDAFVKMESARRKKMSNKISIIDKVDCVGTFIIQDGKDGGFGNDN